MPKDLLGDKVFVVLGGRHPSESIYLQEGRVMHHVSSPLRLMAERKIDPVFDLVVSGEGEWLIPWVGEKISQFEENRIPFTEIREEAGKCHAPGKWIMGSVKETQISTVVSPGIQPERRQLLAPCEAFGVRSEFGVFGGRPTAHVFSEMSRGCRHDCRFCSERRTVNGPVTLEGAASRLYYQLKKAVEMVAADSPGREVSAFVEDSTILGGDTFQLQELIRLLRDQALDILFGAQMTIDQILSLRELLPLLREVGLAYLFVGIETFDPTAVGGISKDVGKGSWANRAEQALSILSDANIQCGAAILFGLGETQEDRLSFLETLAAWREKYGSPNPISLNWAVQHPLHGDDGGCNYDYTQLGLPNQKWEQAFARFGEASVCYPIAGQTAPTMKEVEEIGKLHKQIGE